MIFPALLVFQAATTTQTGEFHSRRVVESSGVAVSRAHPGVLWTHNDSGDGPYLYATDLHGRDLGFLLVPGADAVDWEDVALGPCPTRPGTCVYLADTGDNSERRSSVTVYAVPEPDPPVGAGDTLRTTAAPAILQLRYPDGAHDVEAIYVSPRDAALYLVSKGRSGGIRLYRVDREQWPRAGEARTRAAVATAWRVQTLDVSPNAEAGRWVTGAAIRPDGRLVAVRTYSEIYLFTPGIGGRLASARERPCGIAGLETGGEAVDFLDDSTLVLTSEALGRRAGRIHTVVCRRS
ncbi:MAG TPA: hypothetical protein VGQ06_05210 [Gemmatimonadales bacterium]|jgi:hypothetical protein|nr:hypothetical protein [Gemmatimonadales bacterium]